MSLVYTCRQIHIETDGLALRFYTINFSTSFSKETCQKVGLFTIILGTEKPAQELLVKQLTIKLFTDELAQIATENYPTFNLLSTLGLSMKILPTSCIGDTAPPRLRTKLHHSEIPLAKSSFDHFRSTQISRRDRLRIYGSFQKLLLFSTKVVLHKSGSL